MMFPSKNNVGAFLIIGIFSLLSGCALTQGAVKLSYSPQIGVAKIEKADTILVNVEVVDSRTIKGKVSTKKNGYGMEMAPITSEEDVVSLLKRVIEVELENRGFHLRVGKTLVLVELSKFYNDFKMGFFAGDAVAELFMAVQVKDAAGNIIYSTNISGEGINRNIQVMGGENAKIALDAALKDAVSKLFQDPQFLESIVKAGTRT